MCGQMINASIWENHSMKQWDKRVELAQKQMILVIH